MRGQCRGSAQAKKRCVHAHSHPTLCHGVPRIFLTAPLSYDAVALHLGQREKLLRYVKLATSSEVKEGDTVGIGRRPCHEVAIDVSGFPRVARNHSAA